MEASWGRPPSAEVALMIFAEPLHDPSTPHVSANCSIPLRRGPGLEDVHLNKNTIQLRLSYRAYCAVMVLECLPLWVKCCASPIIGTAFARPILAEGTLRATCRPPGPPQGADRASRSLEEARKVRVRRTCQKTGAGWCRKM